MIKNLDNEIDAIVFANEKEIKIDDFILRIHEIEKEIIACATYEINGQPFGISSNKTNREYAAVGEVMNELKKIMIETAKGK